MKIIHLADIHWRGLSRHDEYKDSFKEFFKIARELNPDVIYIGGDIVHSKTQGISPELIDSLCWWFKGLSDIAPTHVILGNHDGLILNKDRQDAISPVIDALNISNLYLYKQSGVYPVKDHEDFNWCVFSCFDEEGWRRIEPEAEKINIALFHGAVWGSKTDIDWNIEGEVTIDLFNDFDFSLLGDIHKKQFLNKEKTIAYCGSSIQQNYGEDKGKGFLFWDIKSKKDFSVKFYEIPHYKPFVTVDWEDNVEKTLEKAKLFSNGSRFRIRSDSSLTQFDSKKLQHDIRKEKNASEVVFKSSSTLNINSIETNIGKLNRENLRDSTVLKELFRNFYNDEDEENLLLLDKYVEKYSSQISTSGEVLRNSRWTVKSLCFDNLFSYGEKNKINFDSIGGITGIFGKNARGKSSIVGSLMYALFNTTDRGSIKNLHIINSRKNNCSAVVEISVNGETIRVSRDTIKHQTRKGDVYASTKLKLHKIDSSGEIIEDLTEEQRRETEKTLRRLIGTPEDFLMTSVASQGEMNRFIKEKASSRKMILTKFLDLEIFDKMHELAKAESADHRSRLKMYPQEDRNEMILDTEKDLSFCKKNLSNYEEMLKNKRSILSEMRISLATSKNPNIVLQEEVNDQEKIIQNKSILFSNINHEISETNLKIEENNKKIKKIEIVKNDFSILSLEEQYKQQLDLEKRVVKLESEYKISVSDLARQKRSIKKLSEVPCGDKFPTCKFIKDSHKDKKLVLKQKEIVSAIKTNLDDVKKVYLNLLSIDIEKKIEKYKKICNLQIDIKNKISIMKIDYNNLENRKEKIEKEIKDLNRNLDIMKSRVVIDKSSGSIEIQNNIKLVELEISETDNKRTGSLEKIAELSLKIKSIKEDIKNIEKIKSKVKIYDLFMNAASKKGVPLQIITTQLPLINSEISKILQGVTGFTVELEAANDLNSMDIFINYGDSRRIIELASGMEKMMSSLAIRVALINVSSLSKTNTLIIDEGFGTLDENNIEACTGLLEKLKKSFNNILIISHVDAIKDAVDNSLEITKNEKDSKVFCP